jgi:hypothetical protein
VASLIARAVGESRFSRSFLRSEWLEAVDARQIGTWDAHRGFRRLGRKTRLPEKVRQGLWSAFERVKTDLSKSGRVTEAGAFHRLADHYARGARGPFEHVMLDEAQDVTAGKLRFFAAIGDTKADGLFFAGDLGQRIFQPPFSRKPVGVEIRGRSRTLTVNYRTSY